MRHLPHVSLIIVNPASADGSWVMCQPPEGGRDVVAVYVEPKLITSPFRLPYAVTPSVTP